MKAKILIALISCVFLFFFAAATFGFISYDPATVNKNGFALLGWMSGLASFLCLITVGIVSEIK